MRKVCGVEVVFIFECEYELCIFWSVCVEGVFIFVCEGDLIVCVFGGLC